MFCIYSQIRTNDTVTTRRGIETDGKQRLFQHCNTRNAPDYCIVAQPHCLLIVAFLCFLAQACAQSFVVFRKAKKGKEKCALVKKNLFEHSTTNPKPPPTPSPERLSVKSSPTHQLSLMEKQLLTLVLIPQRSELACLEKLLILRGPLAYV